MASDDKLTEAASLIDDFAQKLLALNNGRAIPRQWKNRLLKALKPPPAKRGRKRDITKTTEAVKLLALNAKEVRKPRDKHHNPATIKDAIARQVGVTRRTIDAIEVETRPSRITDPTSDPELQRAYIDGMAAALDERLDASDKAEELARREKAAKKFPNR